MKVSFYGAIVAIALALAAPLGLRSAYAQDVQFSSFAEMSSVVAEQNARIQQLEAHLASLSRTTESGAIVGDGGCDSKPGCGSCGGCDDCCNKAMIYGGAEIVALKVFQSGGIFGNNDYQPGARIWLGGQRDDGLGIRARFFDYTQTIAQEDIDIENFDIEMTDNFCLGYWNILVSGGARYTEYREENTGVNAFATGLTVGFQGNRALNDRLSLFASLQESIMFGNDVGSGFDDVTFTITEVQLGVQANRCLNSGATVFVRTGVEAQYYNGISNADSEMLGLFGFFATLGFQR